MWFAVKLTPGCTLQNIHIQSRFNLKDLFIFVIRTWDVLVFCLTLEVKVK